MNEDLLNDLKQFITATVSQATAELATKADMDARFADMDARFADMDARFDDMDARFDDLDSKLTTIADAHAENLEEHDRRLRRLETSTA